MNSPIPWISISLALGIVSGKGISFLEVSYWIFLSIAFLTGLLSFLLSKYKVFYWGLLFCSIFFLGVFLYLETEEELQFPVFDKPVTLTGIVSSTPKHFQSLYGRDRIQFKFRSDTINLFNSSSQDCLKNILVTTYHNGVIEYGDRIRLTGIVKRPSPSRNPGGFNLMAYLESLGISGLIFLKNPHPIEILAKNQGNPFLTWIHRLRENALNRIERSFPENISGIASALLFGERSRMNWKTKESFAKSGSAHFLAISGFHIGLLALMMSVLLKSVRLGNQAIVVFTIAFLIFYCLLTGSSPSVTRATIMMTILFMGKLFLRESSLLTTLSWTAIIVLVWNPFQIFHPGFQLSYMAVVMIGIHLERCQILKDDLAGDSKSLFELLKNKAVQMLTISWMVWLGIAPIILQNFYILSPVGILSNIILFPLVALALAVGFFWVVLGSVHPLFWESSAPLFWFFLKSMMVISQWLTEIPYSAFRMKPLSLLNLFIYYLLLMGFLFRKNLQMSLTKFCFMVLIGFNLVLWRSIFSLHSEPLKITFLNVGHGDSALIEFPTGKKWLVDTGSGEPWPKGRTVVAPFLWNRGIFHLDAIVITHPDYDHSGGLKYLLSEFSVDVIYDNGNRTDPSYEKIIKNNNVKRISISQGWVFRGPDFLQIRVLHPPLHTKLKSHNNQSIVFQIRYRDSKILFTGDIEEQALQQILEGSFSLQSDLLKVNHHGSDERELGDTFFYRVKPKIAIISESEINRFGLPSKRTLHTLKQLNAHIFQTGKSGAIQVTTDGKNWKVKEWMKDSKW